MRIPGTRLMIAGLALAAAPFAAAQLRESSIAGQYSRACDVETRMPDGTILKWQAGLSDEGDTRLSVRLDGSEDSNQSIDFRLEHPVIGIDSCQVYGTTGGEIAAIDLRPRPNDHPARSGVVTIVSFVRLVPRLEHLTTISKSGQSGYGASLEGDDYSSWCCGDGLFFSRLEILPYLGSLFVNRVESRRPVESRKIFPIGTYPRVIGGAAPASPPQWLSSTLAGTVISFSPGFFPIKPVTTPSGTMAGLLSAAPEEIFPPSTLVLHLQVGRKRLHGLLFRDLSNARSRDRERAESRLEDYLAPPGADDDSAGSTFEWSADARSWFGEPILKVAVVDETTIIGTIERKCAEVSDEAIPTRDLWMFKADLREDGSGRIDTQLVSTCKLIPVMWGFDDGFLYRTFDNGQVEPLVENGETVGLRTTLHPPLAILSKGEPRVVDWEDVTVHYKWGDLAQRAIDEFEEQRSEIVYRREATAAPESGGQASSP